MLRGALGTDRTGRVGLARRRLDGAALALLAVDRSGLAIALAGAAIVSSVLSTPPGAPPAAEARSVVSSPASD